MCNVVGAESPCVMPASRKQAESKKAYLLQLLWRQLTPSKDESPPISKPANEIQKPTLQ